jgi:hypothetical protein
MDQQAPERQAGPAPVRRGASGSDAARAGVGAVGADGGGAGTPNDAAQAARAAAARADAGGDAALDAAAQAICRILHGGLLDAFLVDEQAAANNARLAGLLPQLVEFGARGGLRADRMVAVLAPVIGFCTTPAGAALATAAGLLPHVTVLLRAPDPGAAHAALLVCVCAATRDPAAHAAMAREPGAAPALLAMLLGAPPPLPPALRGGEGDSAVGALAQAARLLGILALPAPRRGLGAASGGARAGMVSGPDVAAAVAAGGGVARTVELLRAALGGGGQGLDAWSAWRLLEALSSFVGMHPAAAAAARAAGAVPLAASAIVAVQRAPGPNAKAALCEGIVCVGLLASAGDLPALAARPGLVEALAGAVALAARGASERWSASQAERLGASASTCVAQLLTGGQGSSDAAAERFLAAGGAAHLVRRRAGARVGQGVCNAGTE